MSHSSSIVDLSVWPINKADLKPLFVTCNSWSYCFAITAPILATKPGNYQLLIVFAVADLKPRTTVIAGA
ncbi:hypothetical protein NMG60_11024405 [Bertholletia excelsa]